MKKKCNITQDELKDYLVYDRETGKFSRRFYTSMTPDNDDARRDRWDKNGYLHICINGHIYSARQLAWLYVTGEWPETYVYVINGDNRDLKWDNLTTEARYAYRKKPVKRKLSKLSPRNKSGHAGVFYNKATEKWIAMFSKKYLGSFEDKGDAIAARQIAEIM